LSSKLRNVSVIIVDSSCLIQERLFGLVFVSSINPLSFYLYRILTTVYHIWNYLLLRTFREHDIRPSEHGERSVYTFNKGHWTVSKVRFSTLCSFVYSPVKRNCLVTFLIQSDTKKRELLKNPTKIEEIQEKKFIDRN